MTAAEWIVLDNLKNGWNYWTNLARDVADKTYLRCVNNKYIRDGKLTVEGEMYLYVGGCRPMEKEE